MGPDCKGGVYTSVSICLRDPSAFIKDFHVALRCTSFCSLRMCRSVLLTNMWHLTVASLQIQLTMGKCINTLMLWKGKCLASRRAPIKVPSTPWFSLLSAGSTLVSFSVESSCIISALLIGWCGLSCWPLCFSCLPFPVRILMQN